MYLGEAGTVWFLYGRPEDVRLLVAQTPATTIDEPFIVKKLVPRGTHVEALEVRGTRGYLLCGDPHLVLLADELGRALDESVRLAREDALVIAEELRVRSPG